VALDDVSFLGNITRFDVHPTSSLLGALGRYFGWGKNVNRVYYTNEKLSCPFRAHWGAGWDGLQWVALDDVSFLGNITRFDARYTLLAVGCIGWLFQVGKKCK